MEKTNYKLVADDKISAQDIQQALELDRRYYSLDDCDQFDLEKCMKWYKINNRIYTMIKDLKTDRIIAYINAAPVNQKAYSEIRNGLYTDSNINDDDIVPYSSKESEYYLYFASIVIDFENTERTVLRPLFNSFIDKIINLTQQGYMIKSIIADAISMEGKNLCQKSGMKKVTETQHSSTIYELSLFPPDFRIFNPKLKELYNLLEEKYGKG